MSFYIDFDGEHVDGASSCAGKIKYSQSSAERAAVAMATKKKEPFEAYPCRYCEGWHIGHPRFWSWTEEQKREWSI